MKSLFFKTAAVCALILLSFSHSLAQVSYEDLVKNISAGVHSNEQAIILLKPHLATEPSAWHQMAGIYRKKLSVIDKLKQADSAAFLQDSVIAFTERCMTMAGKKEGKKTPDYYPEYGSEKLADEQLRYKISATLKQEQKNAALLKALSQNFQTAVGFYTKAQTTYARHVEVFPNYYHNILASETTFKRVAASIGALIDSCTKSMEAYRAIAVQDSTILYARNTKWAVIKEYGKDGFGQTDFYADTLILWDYKDHSNQILKVMFSEEIRKLRAETLANNERLDEKIAESKQNPDRSELYMLDTASYKLLKKWDSASVLFDIFAYKELKIRCHNKAAAKTFDISGDIDTLIEKFYDLREVPYDLIEQFRVIESTPKLAEHEERHQEFFKRFYPGGISDFISAERAFLDSVKKEIGDEFEDELLAIHPKIEDACEKYVDETIYPAIAAKRAELETMLTEEEKTLLDKARILAAEVSGIAEELKKKRHAHFFDTKDDQVSQTVLGNKRAELHSMLDSIANKYRNHIAGNVEFALEKANDVYWRTELEAIIKKNLPPGCTGGLYFNSLHHKFYQEEEFLLMSPAPGDTRIFYHAAWPAEISNASLHPEGHSVTMGITIRDVVHVLLSLHDENGKQVGEDIINGPLVIAHLVHTVGAIDLKAGKYKIALHTYNGTLESSFEISEE